jgi:hypothetical protein
MPTIVFVNAGSWNAMHEFLRAVDPPNWQGKMPAWACVL